jgi:hypothetical protein
MDLHRRRSVLVRMTDSGVQLETVRVSYDPEYLQAVIARAGEAPDVVLEATYGRYLAADTLAELGARVQLAHPLGVKTSGGDVAPRLGEVSRRGHLLEMPPRPAQVRATPQQFRPQPPGLRPVAQGAHRDRDRWLAHSVRALGRRGQTTEWSAYEVR